MYVVYITHGCHSIMPDHNDNPNGQLVESVAHQNGTANQPLSWPVRRPDNPLVWMKPVTMRITREQVPTRSTFMRDIMPATPGESRSLLAIFAHPDDEAFGTGGTLAHYARQGVRVGLVCATRGEVGEIADPSLATPETLGKVREGELQCAADALGISDLIFLDHRDSGMEGTVENEHPDAFINADADKVIAKLVGIIRQLRPDVVVTFEANGGYGHPDHKAIHRHTVAAVAAAGDASQYIDQGVPWQPKRLFFTAIPRSTFVAMRDRMEEFGIDTSEFNSFEAHGWPDDQVHLTLDVSEDVDVKWKSFECHRTQFDPNGIFFRLPVDIMKQLMSSEHFGLGWPTPTPGLKLYDLFT